MSTSTSTTAASPGATPPPGSGPTVDLRRAGIAFAGHDLWQDVTLQVARGEFLAVLGPNGAGKTTLLKVLLGLQPLTSGSVTVCGRPPHRGSDTVGYVPQQKGFDPALPMRGRDLVRLGLDGHRFGPATRRRRAAARVQRALEEVGAKSYADSPVGLLSGGEAQRLRIAQALLGEPRLLLCDEPLLSLDLAHQQAVSALIDTRRREAGTSVVFVTHEVNPILPLVDRVLYLVGSRWAIGTPEEVMTSESLTALYGTQVDVLRVRGRIVVVGAPDRPHAEHADGHHHHPDDHQRSDQQRSDQQRSDQQRSDQQRGPGRPVRGRGSSRAGSGGPQ